MTRTDQVKETIKEVFRVEANVSQIEPEKLANYWYDSLDKSVDKLLLSPKFTYPLDVLGNYSSTEQYEKFKDMMKRQNDRAADKVGEKEMKNYLKKFYDELPGATRRGELMNWDNGFIYVTNVSLSHLRFIFNRGYCESEIIIDKCGIIRTDEFFRNDFFGELENDFNVKPNNFKALMLIHAMRYWVQGFFYHAREYQRNWIDNEDSLRIADRAKIKSQEELLRETYFNTEFGKLPRDLIK